MRERDASAHGQVVVREMPYDATLAGEAGPAALGRSPYDDDYEAALARQQVGAVCGVCVWGGGMEWHVQQGGCTGLLHLSHTAPSTVPASQDAPCI